MNVRTLALVVLDALEVCDQDHAVAVLLDVLDEAPEAPRCSVCGAHAWPEDRARHVLSIHDRYEADLDERIAA